MKKCLILTLAIALPIYLFAQEKSKQGIEFFDGSWATLLQKAKQENKPVFVDVYTDWCPPCKRMDQEVFPLPDVSEAYNNAFINYKLDAEKGEGPALVKQYKIRAYPTYLYFDPNGNLLQRVLDYQEPSRFIAIAQETLEKNKTQLLSSLEEQYQQKKKDKPFLKHYIEVKKSLELETSPALDLYFESSTAEERMDTANQRFFIQNLSSTQAKAFHFMQQQYPSLNTTQKQEVAPKLYALLVEDIEAAFQQADRSQVKDLFQQTSVFIPYLPDKQKTRFYRMQLHHAQNTKDREEAKKAAYAYVKPYLSIPLDSIRAEDKRRYEKTMQPFRTGELDSTQASFQEERPFIINQYTNEIATYLYEASHMLDQILDPKDPALADALTWSEQIIKIIPDDQFPNIKLFIDFRDQLKKKVEMAAHRHRNICSLSISFNCNMVSLMFKMCIFALSKQQQQWQNNKFLT